MSVLAAPPTTVYDPRSTALVIIDMQNDFCDTEGGVALRGEDVKPLQAIVPRLSSFIDRMRSEGMHIVYVRTEHGQWTDSETWRSRHNAKPGLKKSGPICEVGSWGAELYELQPAPTDALVTKHRYSAFIGTDLDLILRARKIDTLLLTGVVTNVCVESTLRHAFMLDYRTVLIEDGCASTNPAAHAGTIMNVQRHFGSTACMDDVHVEAAVTAG